MITSEIYSVYVLLQKNNAGIVQGTNDIIMAIYDPTLNYNILFNVEKVEKYKNKNS